MHRKIRTIGALLLLLALVQSLACTRKSEDSKGNAESKSQLDTEPPELEVRAGREDLLFSWIDEKGAFHDVSRIEEIPEEARAQVLVRDLSRSAMELRSADYLYVADLRIADEDGRYPCGTVSRRHFDRRGIVASASQLIENKAAAGEPVVTLYGTAWCGVCKAARKFLKEQGVAFLDRDIEHDEGAEAELQARAAAQGLVPQGVPVIDVAGSLLIGFDRKALSQVLEQKGFLE